VTPWADTDISEENGASIFRVKVCRFRNMLTYNYREVKRSVVVMPKERRQRTINKTTILEINFLKTSKLRIICKVQLTAELIRAWHMKY
jgi:hypothetical protein